VVSFHGNYRNPSYSNPKYRFGKGPPLPIFLKKNFFLKMVPKLDIYNGDALPEDKEAPSVRSRARGKRAPSAKSTPSEGVALESAFGALSSRCPIVPPRMKMISENFRQRQLGSTHTHTHKFIRPKKMVRAFGPIPARIDFGPARPVSISARPGPYRFRPGPGP
jgi:hypothetical protein